MTDTTTNKDAAPGSEKFVINAPTKRGPGRPKGSTTKQTTPTSQKANTPTQDVRQAMATLDSAYKVIGTALFMFGLTESATEWANRAETLRTTNQESLTASPKLAKAIANVGGTGGAATFFITHALAIAPVVAVVRVEASAKVAERQASQPQRQRATADTIPEPATTGDPTLIPGMPVPSSPFTDAA